MYLNFGRFLLFWTSQTWHLDFMKKRYVGTLVQSPTILYDAQYTLAIYLLVQICKLDHIMHANQKKSDYWKGPQAWG